MKDIQNPKSVAHKALVWSLAMVLGVTVGGATSECLLGHVEHRLSQETIKGGKVAYTVISVKRIRTPRSPRIELLEDGRALGPSVTTQQQVSRRRHGAYASIVRETGDGRYAHLIYFTASDGSNPQTNNRSYVVRYPRRYLPATAALLVLIWCAAFSFVVRVRRWAIQPTQIQLEGWGVVTAVILTMAAVYSVFVLQAWLVPLNAGWLLSVFLIGLPLALTPGRLSLTGSPVWVLWFAGFVGWSVFSAIAHESADSGHEMLPFLSVCVCGLALCLGLGGRLAVPARSSFGVFTGLLLGLAGGMLARDAGFDVLGSLRAIGVSTTWNGGVVNAWTAKFSGHWFLAVAWLALAAVVPGGKIRVPWTVGLTSVVVAVVVLNGSMSAMIGLLLSTLIVCIGLGGPRTTRRILVSCLAAGVLSAPLLVRGCRAIRAESPTSSVKLIASLTDFGGRSHVWDFSSELISNRPTTGWGSGGGHGQSLSQLTVDDLLDGDEQLRSEKGSRRLVLPGGHPHNAALQIWMDLGLIGALLAAGLVWAIGRSIARVEENRLQHAALLGLLTVNATYLAFNYPLWEPEVLSILWMSAALASTVLPKPEVSRRELVRNAIAVGAIVAIGCSILVVEKVSRRLVKRDLLAGTVLRLDEGVVADDGRTWDLVYGADLDAGAQLARPGGVDRPLIQGWAYAPGRGAPDHVVVFVGSEPVGVVWPERPTREVFLRTADRDVRALTAGFVLWADEAWLGRNEPVTVVATYGDEHLAVELPTLSQTDPPDTG